MIRPANSASDGTPMFSRVSALPWLPAIAIGSAIPFLLLLVGATFRAPLTEESLSSR